ncbi:MAG TPA: lipase maturation factor family protein [Gemmatimonadales bacterium]|nr:lipase maturation factor family protein [Gemmatimonadales bacterium]
MRRTYLLSRWLFLRLLGLVYLIAFASLAVQITGLVGEHGLLPVGQFLDWAHSIYGPRAYRLFPTLFWLGSGDLPLHLTAWAGVVLSIALMLGVAPAPVLLLLSALSFGAEIAYTLPGGRGAGLVPRWAAAVLGWVAPLRSFNGYGLFRVMTTERPEIVIEGSRDGTHWQAYEFRYQPGPVERRPGFVAPYQPRLDWQMWFAGLDPMGNWEWLRSLAGHLRAGTPEVLALLGRAPFAGAPPCRIRLAVYAYRFSTAAERARTGAWWVRELTGYLPPVP